MAARPLSEPFSTVILGEPVDVPGAALLASQLRLLQSSDIASGQARRLALALVARLDLQIADPVEALVMIERAIDVIADLGLTVTASARHVVTLNGRVICRATVVNETTRRALTVEAGRMSCAAWAAALVLLDDGERNPGGGIAGIPVGPAAAAAANLAEEAVP